MSRSNRGYIAAGFGVAAVIVAGVLAVALDPNEPELTGNVGYEKQWESYRPGGSDCEPAEIQRLAGRERTDRTISCQEQAEQRRLERNDLIQQRRSADAADAMAVMAYQQTRIAAWGIALGFITMAAAIGAAFYARQAAVATEENVRIAQDASRSAGDALTIAQRNADAAALLASGQEDTAKRRLRAYLGVLDVIFCYMEKTPDEFVPGVRVVVRNFGSTPSHLIRVNISATWLPVGGAPFDLLEHKMEFDVECFPNNPVVMPFGFSGEPPEGRGRLTVIGRIDYQDIFEDEHFMPVFFGMDNATEFSEISVNQKLVILHGQH